MDAKELQQELFSLSDPLRRENSKRFFKIGKGDYGEGDEFIGVPNPKMRELSKKFINLNLNCLQELLSSRIHEERQTALFIMAEKYKKKNKARKRQEEIKTTKEEQKELAMLYLKNTVQINNWDLVDCSAQHILGKWMLENPTERKTLYELAKSKNLWEKRIAIISTFAFIREKDFVDSLAIAEILLQDSHDLIHKAVGWMLREVGNRNLDAEEEFLKKHYKTMPRTMLRYAIEKFPEKKRLKYLKGKA